MMEPPAIKETDSGVCIEGFRAAGQKEGKYGLALILAGSPCETAAVFTSNEVKAAPVLLTRERVEKNKVQAIIANSGNANACVSGGLKDAEKMAEIAAKELGIKKEAIAVASTGIIGRKIKLEVIEALTKKVVPMLSGKGGRDAAKAIMTTDTKEKMLSYEYKGIEIGGICKGAGMIAPDMATMLCFLTTNAALGKKDLQSCLKDAVDDTFNMLVVDNDMSTNDMVLLLSSGKKECRREDFSLLLSHVCKELTKLLALDAEGATKFMEVEVLGARDEKEARAGVKSIISSNLVKTAMHGENPNWGRIAAALGTVMEIDFEKTDLFFESEKGSAVLVKQGEMKDLAPAHEVLKGKNIKVTVNLNLGKAGAKGWGCDLSCGYVKINAEYN